MFTFTEDIEFYCVLHIFEIIIYLILYYTSASDWKNNNSPITLYFFPPTTTCPNSYIISPITWLLVGGITGLYTILLLILAQMKILLFEAESRSIFLIWIHSFINFCWAIIAALILLFDNQDCYQREIPMILLCSLFVRCLDVITFVKHTFRTRFIYY